MASVQCKLLVVVFLTLCLLEPLVLAISVEYCNKKANYDVKVSDVAISPYPVERGKETTFNISASSAKPINGGKLVIDVSYFVFHVRSETHDICEETSCPVSTGDFVISHTQVLPGYTPPGSYTLEMTMEDGNGHKLTCITFGFSIGLLESEAVAAS